jgi:hypothetical protein
MLCYQAIAWRDFGATYFVFDAALSPGGKIAGRIHFQRESPMQYSVVSRVECRRVARGEDGGNSITTLWFSERKISPSEFGTLPTGRRYIPIEFDLPSSALESSKRERIQWQLSVKHTGRWPRSSEGRFRVPYKDRFQIPVTRAQQLSVA